MKRRRNEMNLNPNCSEATMRINLKNLTKAEIKQLSNLLDCLSMESEKDEESKWYETSFSKENIFGISVMVIKGETPYSEGEWLEDQLKNLPFGHLLEIEYAD